MLNEEIRDKEVRIVDSDGGQLGIMSSKDALKIAREKNLDLVKIAPQANPPVCKIMDYGKYRFETAKREKEARKNQKIVSVKEVRLSLSIDEHDFNTKVNHAKKFLTGKDKVKVTVRFRGRELAHTGLGIGVIERFIAAVEEEGTVDKRPKLEGKSMSVIVSPKG